MSSPTANEATIREAVRATIALLPLDKITGQPTNSSVNHLKQQVAKIAAAVKTTNWGGRHGHLALVLSDTEYQTVTGTPDITTERITAPPIVPEALANNATLTSRTRVMADHNLACHEFWLQEAVDSIIVDRVVREVIDAAYVEELEDDYVGYNTQSIKSILSHLRSEWCIITTLERKQAAHDFRVIWDLTSHITKFARELDKQQKLCRQIGVPASDASKVQYFVESMYASDMFDDKEMQAWEVLTEQTWENAKTHFFTLYKSKEKFNAEREARTGGYDSANSAVSMSTSPFLSSLNAGPLLPSQQTLADYTTSLEGALEAATDHAAALTTAQGELLRKLDQQHTILLAQNAKFLEMLAANSTQTGTPAPTSNRPRTRDKKPSVGPRFCNSCKKDKCFHEDDDCFALEKNAAKRPAWHHQFQTKPNSSFSNAATPIPPAQLRHGIFNGTIPSAVSDTGATSTAGASHDPFHPGHTKSTKTFVLPTGNIAPASTATTLLLNLRPPANQVDIVPGLTQTLLSGSKLADAGYTAIYDKNEVNFYNSHTIHVQEKSVLRGYRCPHTGLWRIPLQPIVLNQNTDTLLLDAPDGITTTNPQFKIHHSPNTLAHLQTSNTPDTLANVYELPSIAQAVRYLHGAAGFPTKSTWLAAIRNGNYSTWPLINIKNVTKHFPESEETQQGHMRGQRQGVRSTRPISPSSPRLSTPAPLIDHTEDILVNVHDNLYSDQTGKFPHISSRGNKYQMILYHFNSNSIWVEATKTAVKEK
eukprot:CCRYP_008358-RA/>CCRYP_008358-RA protein AED:0.67 eAED:0.67 QI:0/0/0/0.5/1/1/2/0/762